MNKTCQVLGDDGKICGCKAKYTSHYFGDPILYNSNTNYVRIYLCEKNYRYLPNRAD